jgi:GT2 family glycosyltransferase
MDISIIVVNYKSKEKLKNCLLSIERSAMRNISFEVIVVENDSGDIIDDFVNNFSWTKLIKSQKNLGMGGGNNLGIKHSRGNYILISNPDIVFEKDCIFNLYNFLKNHHNVALVGPKLLNPDRSLQYSCAHFPKIYLPLLRRTAIGNFFPNFLDKYFLKHESYDKIKEVDWLLGACFLVRRKEMFLKEDKLFDERYFMYFEDVDLCRRIKEKSKKVIYLPASIAIHDHLRSSARLAWYLAIFKDKLARQHIISWWRYFIKWKFH